jgi:hypothetical protein
MRSSHLPPSTVRAALRKALGLAGTSLLLLVGLAGTALARPLPGDGAGNGTVPSTPVSDAGSSSSLLLIVAIAATVIVLSGLAALIVAARRRTHHQGASIP